MAEQRVRQMAHQDALTGLPNRNLLYGRLERTMSRAKRFGRIFGVGKLDVDNIKPINDRYGHEMGDAVLKVVATRLLSSIRAIDTVARVGGEEFILVIEEANDRSDLKRVAERILAMVTRPIHVNGNNCSIGVSLGYSVYPDDGENLEGLIRNADTAMFEVKSKGSNGYRFFKHVPPEGAN
ncbi:MAG: GGDEF domain-containing protein, partial [Alphaproteobacteria bacterium]